MPIKLQCQCGRMLRVPDASAGRRGRCPACGNVFIVPEPAAEPGTEPLTELGIQPLSDLVATEQAPAAVGSDSNLYDLAEDPAETARIAATRAAAINRRTRAISTAQSSTTASSLPTGLAERASTYLPPARKTNQRQASVAAIGSAARPYRYLLLLLALLPLAWATFRPPAKEDVAQRISRTIDDNPKVAEKVDDYHSVDELLAALPGDKIEGALLSHDTYIHWAFALASAAGFLGVVLILFPTGHTKLQHLVIICLFTGTAGIFLLLGFQWLAFHMPLFTPHGIISLLLDIVWLIGQSYALTFGHHGFLLSFIGFTAGVGLCEETTKALPLIWKARTDGFYSWRTAMIWGIVSGVGFGVSEAITYSHRSYNGIQGGQIYLIRFISCVALHAIWSAAAGINIFRRQDHFRGQLHPLEWILQVAITVIVPMVLHGLYDTLLTQDYDWAALLIAFASFGWLAFQIELAKRKLDELPAGYAA